MPQQEDSQGASQTVFDVTQIDSHAREYSTQPGPSNKTPLTVVFTEPPIGSQELHKTAGTLVLDAAGNSIPCTEVILQGEINGVWTAQLTTHVKVRAAGNE